MSAEAKNPSVKLTCLMLRVEMTLPELQALIRAGMLMLPHNHIVRTVHFLATDDRGGLLLFGGVRQVYLTQWSDIIVPVLGESYLGQLNGEVQRELKCKMIAARNKGIPLYNRAALPESLLPVVSLQVKIPEGPGKKTKVVLPNGMPATRPMKQGTLELVQEPGQMAEETALLTVADPFKLQDSTKLLKAFLRDRKPWEDPAPAPQREKFENAKKYVDSLRRLNTAPKHWDCIKAFFPPCIRNHDKYAPILAGLPLSEEVAQSVKDLAAFYNGKAWTGLLGLLPSPNMLETNYGLQCNFPVDKSTCVFEAIRRALRLEKALAALAVDVLALVNGMKSLASIPGNTQKTIRLLLEFSCGIKGQGEEMWAPLEEAGGLSRLEEGSSPGVLEARGWLEELRALRPEAFKVRYVMGTQVGWMLPSLALVFAANRGGDLSGEGALGAQLAALKNEWGARERVYVECLKPIWKYGGILTK